MTTYFRLKAIALAILLAVVLQFSAHARVAHIGSPAPRAVGLFDQLPDLVISDVKIEPAKITVTVKNVCKGDAGPSSIALQIYQGPQKSSQKGSTWDFTLPAIKAGQTTTTDFDKDGTIPSFVDHYYRIDVDGKNKVQEAAENNNWKEKSAGPFPQPGGYCDKAGTPAPPTPAPGLLPDLMVSDVKVEAAKMTVTVKNVCKGDAAPSAIKLDIYKGTEKSSGAASHYTGNLPAIKAGQTASFSASKDGTVPSFVGIYYRIDIDPTNQIKEAAENNNWKEKTAGPFPQPAGYCDGKK